MCVIFASKKDGRLPTFEEMVKAEDVNPDGIGIAWIWRDRVHFRKGINSKQAQALIKKYNIKPPFVFHARIASSGGVSEKLCHPFPVNKSVDLRTSGSLKGSVLFHNGHVSQWEQDFIEVCETHRPPKGAWSDSRMLAWEGHLTRGASLAESAEYLAILDNLGNLDLTGARWEDEKGMLTSNDFWKYNFYAKAGSTHGTGYTFDDQEEDFSRQWYEKEYPSTRYNNPSWDRSYWEKKESKYWSEKEKILEAEIQENEFDRVEIERQKLFNTTGY